MLRNVFGAMMEQETEGWSECHNEQLHNFNGYRMNKEMDKAFSTS